MSRKFNALVATAATLAGGTFGAIAVGAATRPAPKTGCYEITARDSGWANAAYDLSVAENFGWSTGQTSEIGRALLRAASGGGENPPDYGDVAHVNVAVGSNDPVSVDHGACPK